ncbi:HET-domain-containing protein [Eremomyces bilateralis CBS 781.70]|uniref:HET-domain-containing protein n=1 Tax=Eremomyces bilateralis CBS 781.70 TaxID=1392243 RepID=A0A6G1FV29_9PEZI|nr:HET-domain-containing protein [Eremomyces bilateralis CBS 781.70]KAF1809644.1 HET-domain-containing protein [Eremomyces bilateralis CBS 781.70]
MSLNQSRSKLSTRDPRESSSSIGNATGDEFDTPAGLSQYRYTPFTGDSGGVRLLNFLPCDCGSAGNPCCDLEIHRYFIDQAPPYVTLSYYWGDPTPSETVCINGAALKITKNLLIALRYVGPRLRKRGLLLWADGMCINQQDTEERGRQVAQMGEVYEKAKYVIAWLGEASFNFKATLKKMKEWHEWLCKELQERNRLIADIAKEIVHSDPFFLGPEGSESDFAWNGFRSMVLRPWWGRAWVVQEALLNQRLRVFYGPFEIDNERLLSAFIIFEQLKADQGRLSFNCSAANLLYLLRNDFKDASSQSGFTFLQALDRTRTFACSDPRDTVYAVLGLVNQGPERLQPNYSLRLSEVDLQVATYLFTTSPRKSKLDFLGFVWSPRTSSRPKNRQESGKPYRPSWVPTWSVNSGHPFGKSINDRGTIKPVYAASGDSAEQARIDGTVLRVTGFCIDTVAKVLVSCERGDAGENNTLLLSWRPKNERKKYVSGGDLDSAWLRCVVADVDRGAFKINKRGYAFPSTSWVSTSYSAQTALQCATYGRRMFYTKKGFMSLGPAICEVGDRVCLFLGGQLLYIIRPNGDGTHSFVGEAYVHGLMDGEAMDRERFPVMKEVFELT